MDKTRELLIDSERIAGLKDIIISAADEISNAINEKRPVWIRHHNDCDGYCAALVLEKSIQKKMYNVHNKESDFFFFYKRFPTRTPYYNYADATRDISIFLSESERFNRKKPLILILDNGSSQEDIFSLKKLNLYGIKPIVIDHHPIGSENDAYISVHLNSGESDISSSMLASEVANILGGVMNPELYAATGAIADKSESNELESYLAIAVKKGYSREFLSSSAQLIDFEVNHLGNSEARSYVQELIFGDIKIMEELMGIVGEEIEKETKLVESIAIKYLVYNEFEDYIVASIDTEKFFNLKGLSNSKITNISRNKLEEIKNKPVAMLGYGSDIITFRINKELDFDMNKIKEKLLEKFPHSMIQGGGHAKAGSIHFSKNLADEIREEAFNFLMGGKDGK